MQAQCEEDACLLAAYIKSLRQQESQQQLQKDNAIVQQAFCFIDFSCVVVCSDSKEASLCCCCVSILLTTFPEPQRNVSMVAVRGAVRPSILKLLYQARLFYIPFQTACAVSDRIETQCAVAYRACKPSHAGTRRN